MRTRMDEDVDVDVDGYSGLRARSALLSHLEPQFRSISSPFRPNAL